MKTLLGREPVLFQTLILAILNLLILFKVVDISADQVGGINAAVAALLGFITRQVVTPLANPKNSDGERLVPQGQG